MRASNVTLFIANVYIPPATSNYAPSTIAAYVDCLEDIQAWVNSM